MADLLDLPIHDAVRHVTPAEYVRACETAIGAHDPALNAFIGVAPLHSEVVTHARFPIAVKDNIATAGHSTSCGSRLLANFVSPVDATVVGRLRGAGAVVVGKTNLDEFAMGSSTEFSAFGPTRNPWNLSHVPGGSSGGSAAAVAARMVPAALGSDTGGSVRQPAAFCGVVGLKPTYGRVSRSGLVAFASSLDQIGIIAKTVREAAELLGVIAGHDPADATSSHAPVDDFATVTLSSNVRDLRFGVVADALEHLDSDVRRNFDEALAVLRAAGAPVREVRIASLPSAVAAYYVIANAEASSNLARFDGIRFGQRAARLGNMEELIASSRTAGFGREVKRRIMLGTFALSAGYYDAYYGRAQRARADLCAEVRAALGECEILLTPTTPTSAFKLAAKVNDPVAMYLSDIFTVPANLAGLPAIAIPAGFDRAGLPLSLQMIAAPFAEQQLLRAASAFERETMYWKRRPPKPL